ncbi:MAG: ParB/RepB/Spo0J family partition protein [Opitutales bacterium]
MSNKSRLGRGLGGLISGAGTTPAQKKVEVASPVKKKTVDKTEVAQSIKIDSAALNAPGYRELEVKHVLPNPYQPRREIQPEQVEELAKSIHSEGLIQPIVVRKNQGKFELIAGERRLHAFKHLKLKKIPARIIEASDASSATLALIENLQRENLNPIDEALGYQSLLRDFDLTQDSAAERVGKGRATVANALRLLKLGSEIQGYLSRRLLSTGHAKVLLSLESEEHQKLLARRIIETGMSVRDAEMQVRRLKEGSGSKPKSRRQTPEAEQTAIRDLEKRMGEHFNTRVALKHTPKKGRITIEYYGNDDLDRILEKLGLQ